MAPYLKKKWVLWFFLKERDNARWTTSVEYNLLKCLWQMVRCDSHDGFTFPSLLSSCLGVTMPVFGSSSPNHIRFSDLSFCYSAYPLCIIYNPSYIHISTKGLTYPPSKGRVIIKMEPLGHDREREIGRKLGTRIISCIEKPKKKEATVTEPWTPWQSRQKRSPMTSLVTLLTSHHSIF